MNPLIQLMQSPEGMAQLKLAHEQESLRNELMKLSEEELLELQKESAQAQLQDEDEQIKAAHVEAGAYQAAGFMKAAEAQGVDLRDLQEKLASVHVAAEQAGLEMAQVLTDIHTVAESIRAQG